MILVVINPAKDADVRPVTVKFTISDAGRMAVRLESARIYLKLQMNLPRPTLNVNA
jgi:hypothetical protein